VAVQPTCDTFYRKKKIIPETHTTIPVLFRKGQFIGGYTALVEQLQKGGKAKPEMLLEVLQQSATGHVDFHKEKTTATLTMPDTSAWTTTAEFVQAQRDGTSLSFSVNMDTRGDGHLHQIYMYFVAEPPPSDPVLCQLREGQMALVGKSSGDSPKSLALFSGDKVAITDQTFDVSPNAFSVKEVECFVSEAKFRVKIPHPGRHFIGKFTLNPTEEEGRGATECSFLIPKDLKIYTIYLTTEPAKE